MRCISQGSCTMKACWLQVLGDNLLSLIKAYSYRNIPLHLVKHIAQQVRNPRSNPSALELKGGLHGLQS